MAERVRVRENDEGRRLLRFVRRGTGSVVTWRRAQIVLLSAQGMPVARIAEVTFTSADRVRLEFCRYLRTLYPARTRLAIVCDNYSPHLTTRKRQRVGTWAAANYVEIAYTPTDSSWLNRFEAQFTALRYFALDGTDHQSHKEQSSMICRYIIWRNSHAADQCLRKIVARANVA
ncbi:hypothetical protein AB0M86_35955 [Streptomyces sp. NPDC051639]|uniref:hypothetical protein n=1 Tax=Streptomyces sp. NPDC051639 TaxID=3155671 RepID=UPI00342D783A